MHDLSTELLDLTLEEGFVLVVFLLDALGNRLRRAVCFPKTAQVVQAVLEFGGRQALPIARDIIDDVMKLVDDVAPSITHAGAKPLPCSLARADPLG